MRQASEAKHADRLYQTVCEMQVCACPCPLACDVAETVPESSSETRLVRPMGAIRTVCACAGIEYRAARLCVCVSAQFRDGRIAPAAAFLSVALWRKRSADPEAAGVVSDSAVVPLRRRAHRGWSRWTVAEDLLPALRPPSLPSPSWQARQV